MWVRTSNTPRGLTFETRWLTVSFDVLSLIQVIKLPRINPENKRMIWSFLFVLTFLNVSQSGFECGWTLESYIGINLYTRKVYIDSISSSTWVWPNPIRDLRYFHKNVLRFFLCVSSSVHLSLRFHSRSDGVRFLVVLGGLRPSPSFLRNLRSLSGTGTTENWNLQIRPLDTLVFKDNKIHWIKHY